MNKLFVSTVLATLTAMPLFVNKAFSAETISTVNTDIASYPIYAALESKPPLIMLLMGRDHSMYYEAYNDMTDLDDDGKIDGLFTPHVVYDGIFESNWCYGYDTKNAMFVMEKLATQNKYDVGTVYTCDGRWSGNFLNYLTSSRMDIVKRILIGGQRYFNMDTCKNKTGTVDANNVFNTCRDAQGYPLLTRQFIPHDTHGWAKSFSQIDMKKRCEDYGYTCTLKDFGDFWNSQSAMFGNVGRELLVVTDNMIAGSGLSPAQNFGSYAMLNAGDSNYADDKALYVWNWVARESAAVGNGGSIKGPLSFGDSKDGYEGNTPMNKPGATGNSGHYTINGVHRHNLVVQACNFGNNPMPSRCKNYGTEANPIYNTVGLLQDFSKQSAVQAYFGLITATWEVVKKPDAQRKAALRAPVSDLSTSTQINAQNGDFKKDSVYALIDVLSLVNDKTPTSTNGGDNYHTWDDCSINGDNNKTTPERGCSDWGNPLVPMIQRSYDYFAGNPIVDTGSDTLKIRHFTDTSDDISYEFKRLSSYPTPYRSFDYCYKPINFILTDENISMDYDTGKLPSSVDTTIPAGFETIKNGEGESFGGCEACQHIFGEYSGTKKMKDSETVHSIKNAVSLMEVRGVSTLEPNLQGSLKGAALAAYIHNNPLRFNFNTNNGVKEKSVPGFEHFAVSMASYLPQFEIYARNGDKVLLVPTCKAPQRNESGKDVKWYGHDQNLKYSFDKEESYTSNCSIADVFYVSSEYVKINGENKLSGIEFRVTYEDNEAGSDFDMDALFTYKVWADETYDNVLNVSITGFYHDTYAGQIGGYSIFGTEGVITPNYSQCDNGKSCSVNSYVVDKRTLYLDMMKVDQHSSNFTLMRSFSDPFNEYNNISGVNNRTSPVSVTSNGPTNYEDHRNNCLNDDNIKNIRERIYKRDDGNVVKFLPSFSSKCKATVTRKFAVTPGGLSADGGFYDSPLDYAAYYGSEYGEVGKGSKADRKKSNPNYFHVTNASKLASQITAALTQAVGTSGNSGTGLTFPTVDVSSDHSAITATYDTSYWTGALHRNKLTYNADGSVNISSSSDGKWNGGEVTFDNSSKILILDKTGTATVLTADLLKNDDDGKYPLSQSILSEFNMADCSIEDKSTLYDKYVAYVYGSGEWEADVDSIFSADTATERLSCSGNKFYGFHARSKEHTNKRTLGAIINSTPQYYSVGGEKKIIFAANDGMVHVVNEANGHVDYSIIPYVSQKLMPRYAKPGNVDHYINDGIMTIVDYKSVSANGAATKKSIVIGTLGSTHPGMYAFDLSASEPVSLWELSPEYYRNGVEQRVRNLKNLGAIQSQITVLPYKVDGSKGLYAIFGNGYNSESGVAGIAVVNALTGKVVSGDTSTGGLVLNNATAKWSEPICNRNDSYTDFKLSSSDPSEVVCYKNGMNQIASIDENHDSVPDYIYSTDLYGNVYRVTAFGGTSNISVQDWKLVHLHTTVTPLDSNGKVKIQPITTIPSLGRDAKGRPMVIVGTGRYLGASDLDSGDIQSVWALSDVNFKQTDSSEIVCSSSVAASDMSCYRKTGDKGLYSRDLEVSNSSSLKDGFRDFKDLPAGVLPEDQTYDVDRHIGWVVNFTTLDQNKISERIKNNMMVLDKHLYVTTMTPGASECDGGGTSHWYDLNINSAMFYKNAATSQSYSPSIFSEMTMGYDKSNRMTDEEPGTHDANERRDRTNATYGCSTVLIGLSTNDNKPEVKVGPEFCPRVESWQFIYN